MATDDFARNRRQAGRHVCVIANHDEIVRHRDKGRQGFSCWLLGFVDKSDNIIIASVGLKVIIEPRNGRPVRIISVGYRSEVGSGVGVGDGFDL